MRRRHQSWLLTSEGEYDKFSEMAAVVADDVLDLHNFLKEFNGDFSRLFSN